MNDHARITLWIYLLIFSPIPLMITFYTDRNSNRELYVHQPNNFYRSARYMQSGFQAKI